MGDFRKVLHMKEEITIYYKKIPITTSKESIKLQHAIGRKLLQYGLWENYGIVFTEDLIQFLDGGKPVLKKISGYPEIFFNISHCKEVVACGITMLAPIGIDVEGERKVSPNVIKKVCSPKELSVFFENASSISLELVDMDKFLNLWTLKESYIKMTGEGLKTPLDTISFEILEDCISSNQQGYFWQTKLQKQYILALSCQKSFQKPIIKDMSIFDGF